MPHVNITISDNTGIEVTGQETAVFIPGGIKPAKGLDANNCIYISAGQLSGLKDILGEVAAKSDAVTIGTAAFIESCLSAGLDVLYYYDSKYGIGDGKELVPAEKNLAFLQDKDTYNVKFLTTGYLGGFTTTGGNGGTPTLSDSTSNPYTWTGESYKTLASVAKKRTDCSVLAHAYYYDADPSKVKEAGGKCSLTLAENLGSGDILSTQLSKHLSGTGAFPEDDDGYVYALVPNLKTTVTLNSAGEGLNAVELVMPSITAYLAKYSRALENGQEWMPLANSERGSAAGLGTPDLKATKYVLDNYTLKDPVETGADTSSKSGASVNGIVELRPYGEVIWGDRTCKKVDDKGIKATTYQSLRMLLCDVSKRAYQAAVRYTYESNNDVTWLNFKSRVTELLGEMVASGVLSGFDMRKQPSNALNKIVCKITLYPNLPVENFDIYINLENAEISTESGAKG